MRWLFYAVLLHHQFFTYSFFNINFQHVQFFGEEVDGPLYTRDVSFPTCNQNDVTYSNPYSSFLVLRCQLYLINVILWPKLYQWSSEIYISTSTIKSWKIIQPARARSRARAVTGRQCPHSGVGRKLSSPLGLGLGLGLLVADSALTLGCGKTFWCVGRFSFYENDRNSETKSWKINPKVQNGPSLRALQTGRWHKLGSYGKNEFSVQKPSVRAQKKHSLHYSNHVLATTRQNCANKKVLFFPK